MSVRFGSRMRGAVLSTCLVSVPVSEGAQAIPLEEALRRAERDHPEVLTAGAELAIAEGEVVTARTLPYNPDLSIDVGRKTDRAPSGASGSGGQEYGVALGQTIEIPGKRSKRVSAAEARVDAARARLEWARHVVRAGVRRTYFLTLAARERVRSAREAEAVSEELKAFARERLQMGAGTQLEYNVAAASAGRARGERLAAERRHRQARVDLAAASAAPAGEDTEAAGDLPQFTGSAASEAEVVARALALRPDLRALQRERAAAQADVRVARALAVPDPTLSASYGRAPDEKSLLFGITVTLPAFNRNQGGRAVARALESRAIVAERAATQAVEREARAAFAAYRTALDAVQAFDREVVDRLAENLELARESFRAGKISLLEFNLVRRDFVETRLAYLDALAELVEARLTLELSAGGSIE